MKKDMLTPALFYAPISCDRFEGKYLTVEVAGSLVTIKWQDELVKKVNFLEEDLFCQVLDEKKEVIAEKKVNYLNETEFYILKKGNLTLRLIKKKKFSLYLESPFHYTPRVVLISENEQRHHLSWLDIEWERIQQEIENETGLSWGIQTRVALFVKRWPQKDSQLQEKEWIYPGLNSHALILGPLKEVSLCVVKSDYLNNNENEDEKIYKEQNPHIIRHLFKLDFKAPKTIAILDELDFKSLSEDPFMYLKREIWESDSIQLRAYWDIKEEDWNKVKDHLLITNNLSWDDVDVIIKLFEISGKEIKECYPDEKKVIALSKDWLFTGLKDNKTYIAALFLSLKEKSLNKIKDKSIIDDTGCFFTPIIVSDKIAIPPRADKIILLPIDEHRIYAYWHIDQKRLTSFIEKISDNKPERIKTYIRVFHDFAGSLYHHMDKDVEVHLGLSDNWYLNVDPDKVWRVQIVAVRDGRDVFELTDVSNPAQTARISTGSNPIVFKEAPQIDEHPSHRDLRSIMGTKENSIGLLIIHLHAHLPYIRRRVDYGTSGIWQPIGYPEEWFHEAIRETYIPLIRIMEKLIEEGVDFRISMDISPTLCNMMKSAFLQEEFLKYMEAHISLARVEIDRTRREAPQYHDTAWMHLNRFLEVRDCFLRYDKDLTLAFKRFQDEGYLEISTCAATHGFLPLYAMYPEAIRAQIQTAVNDYEYTFDRKPLGIWLPECAYVPGLEKYLEEVGLKYFFTETHAILLGDCPSAFGTHAPVYLKGSDVAAFARDPETGKQVWSGEEGYPGDPDYLEFHIKGGPLKYNRITSRQSNYKEPYVRSWAIEKAARHAQHFMEARNFRFEYIKNWFWKKPLVVAMYDAELFGHHWYEGPDFLYFLFKKLYYNQNQTELITPSAYLARYPRNQEMFINPSSWGDKGTFDKWMYGSVSWMYRHSHEAIEELREMVKDLKKHPDDIMANRIVKQAQREVLQSMNSDLAFVISNGHFVDKMKGFFFESLNRFWKLASIYWLNRDDKRSLCQVEKMCKENPIFPKIDPLTIIK